MLQQQTVVTTRLYALLTSTTLAIALLTAALGCNQVESTLTVGAAAGERDAETVISLTGRTMGTTYSVKYVPAGSATAKAVQSQIDRLLDQINRQMSTYLPDSELSRFNRAPADAWFDVSSETAHVAERALQFTAKTDGAFDVTIAPLLRHWEFGAGGARIGQQIPPPPEDVIQSARKLVGASKLHVRLDPPGLKKDVDGLHVDLSAIAKGYAVDAVVELLHENALVNCMVEIGGEVRAAGLRPDGKPWRIGIEAPTIGKRALTTTIPLCDLAMATSGDYRNYRSVDGRLITHIIDPRTGAPLPYRGMSVTVVASECLDCDALATAVLVMGPDEGYNWCVKNNIAAFFQLSDEESAARSTPRFKELTVGPD